MNADVYDLIFTHAADGERGSGGRFVTTGRHAGELLPTEAFEELKVFLGTLTPADAGPAYAMRRFAAQGHHYACVAVSYAGFADADGREGVLSHARVIRLEWDSAWVDAYPLVAQAQELEIDRVLAADPLDRLQAYLTLIGDGTVVAAHRLSRADLQTLPRHFAEETIGGFLEALADRSGSRGRARPPERIGVPQLARAWATLPVGLQIDSPWAYAAADGAKVRLIWDPQHGAATPRSEVWRELAARYVHLIYDRPDDLRPLVEAENLTLAELAQRIPQLPSGASRTNTPLDARRQPENPEMSQKKNKQDPRPRPASDAPIDSGTVVDLNRQFAAMEASLRDYIDQRFAALASGAPAPVAPKRTAGATRQSTTAARLERFAVPAALIAGVLITLGLLAAFGMLRLDSWRGARQTARQQVTARQPAQRVDASSGTNSAAAPAARGNATVRALIRTAEKDNGWTTAFMKLSEREPETVVALIDDAMQQGSSTATHNALQQLRAGVANGGASLTPKDREKLRRLLLQHVAMIAAPDASIVIDDDLRDLTKGVVEQLERRTKAKPRVHDPASSDFQGEIILRWLEMHSS